MHRGSSSGERNIQILYFSKSRYTAFKKNTPLQLKTEKFTGVKVHIISKMYLKYRKENPEKWLLLMLCCYILYHWIIIMDVLMTVISILLL